jgi:hypothetical protein
MVGIAIENRYEEACSGKSRTGDVSEEEERCVEGRGTRREALIVLNSEESEHGDEEVL